MIERPSKKVIESLVALEQDADFKAVLEWIEQSRSETLGRLTHEYDDRVLRQTQGAAADLSELLRTARNARELMASMRRD